jgi:hypothetical protein
MRPREFHSRKPHNTSGATCPKCTALERENAELRRALSARETHRANERSAIRRELGVARDVVNRLLGAIPGQNV